jgi:macrolide transport system ATP-binding/permease protein
MGEPVLVISEVTRTYRLGDVDVHALKGVSLTVERGEFVAIMGSSGSGKSTLLNILGCLDHPSSGAYRLEGVDTASLSETALALIRSRRIGFVFQNFNLLARTSALENVALPMIYAGRVDEAADRARQSLALLGLADREESQPNQLSGGQQQRTAMARALINDPAIILADEPTGNLDSQTSHEIMGVIGKLNRENGITVVLVTHEPEMAAYADRIVTLRDGLILSDQRTREAVVPAPPPMPAAAPAADRPSPWLNRAWLWRGMAFVAALRAIRKNKLRSALTVLGIFIGVAALIAMVSIGEGAKAAVHARMQSLGTDLLIALPASSHAGGVRGGQGSTASLRVSDALAILEEDEAVADVSYVNRQNAQVVAGDENWSTAVLGVTPSYLSIRSWPIESGRGLEDADEHDAKTVCLLGQTVADNLFGDNVDPLGATILVKNVPMQVVGVLSVKGHSANGQDQDDVVLIPFSTSQQRILGVSTPTTGATVSTATVKKLALSALSGATQPGDSPLATPAPNPFGIQPKLTGFVNSIYIQARGTDMVKTALDQVTKTLEQRHRIKPGQDDDFNVHDLTEIAEVAEQNMRVLELLLAAIASISLVVGGIGIMNIMLVSVTERTREIGIRMAIGARRNHVLLQFLVEAMLLSTAGGGAGVLAGIVVAKIISAVANWPTLLDPVVSAAAFVFSGAVGMFFGFYPARRASRLNPIDALRFE